MFKSKKTFSKWLNIIAYWICNYLIVINLGGMGSFDLVMAIPNDLKNITIPPMVISLLIIIGCGLIEWSLIVRFNRNKKLSKFLWFHMIVFPLTLWYEIHYWKVSLKQNGIILDSESYFKKMAKATIVMDGIVCTFFGILLFGVCSGIPMILMLVFKIYNFRNVLLFILIGGIYITIIVILGFNIYKNKIYLKNNENKKIPAFINYVGNALQFIVN